MKEAKFIKEYKEIMHQVPDVYKLKHYNPTSLTNIQILACLKIYIEKDAHGDGWILVKEMADIIRNSLGFRVSEKEIFYLLQDEYSDDFKDINKIPNEKVNFATFIRVIDILKIEKLVLVQIGNKLNYLVFTMLMLLLILFIGFFYNFKKPS